MTIKADHMKKILFAAGLLLMLCITSCNNKPSDNDIKKKILLEYVCAENAQVNDLKIVHTKDAESIAGLKGYEYVVQGEVEWTKGCQEFGAMLLPGQREKFEDKRVFLIKGEDGVWR
jgi:hypothetical protein